MTAPASLTASLNKAARQMSIAQRTHSQLPVTLIAGFLGSGKTTLLLHLLSQTSLRVAVVVNDLASLNVDAELIEDKGQDVVRLQNGCVCCSIREDLFLQISELASSGLYDSVFLESSGVSSPVEIAQTFSRRFSDSEARGELSKALKAGDAQKAHAALVMQLGGLGEVARIDAVVTVLDSSTALEAVRSEGTVRESDARSGAVADLVVEQIEFANVILLNKTDITPLSELQHLRSIIAALNPSARMIDTVRAVVDIKEIVGTRRFDMGAAIKQHGWIRSLDITDRSSSRSAIPPLVPKCSVKCDSSCAHQKTSHVDQLGITSFLYERRRPFHPGRLYHFFALNFRMQQISQAGKVILSDKCVPENPRLGGLLRSKGFIWVASYSELSGEWGQAGPMVTISPGRPWWVSVPRSEWPLSMTSNIESSMSGAFGDRRQRLVFIGQNMDILHDKIVNDLDACLLTQEELDAVTGLISDGNDDALQTHFDCPFSRWE